LLFVCLFFDPGHIQTMIHLPMASYAAGWQEWLRSLVCWLRWGLHRLVLNRYSPSLCLPRS
jgi:hypothetical protein